jgi:hypothetical protein
MSRTARPDADLTHYCEWCGQEIVEETQECPALDDGRCRP